MDANDLYSKITDGDPYARIRPIVDALEAQDTMLGDEERSFLSGVQANMVMDAAIEPAIEQALKQMLLRLRQRIHAAGG